MSLQSTLAPLVAVAVALTVKWLLRRRKSRLPLPPGPKGLPLLGNILQMPQDQPWATYRDWSKTYGEIVYLEALGTRVVVLNSLRTALELLDKRSVNYSDRPVIPAMQLMKLDFAFSFMQYDSDWKAHRKGFQQHVGPNSIHQYESVHEQEISAFLRRLSEQPDDFLQHVRDLFGSIMLRVSYGSDDPNYNDSLIKQAEALVMGFAELTVPGRYLVNIFPIMKHIPSWIPGAAWRRRVDALAEVSQELLNRPYEDVKKSLDTGHAAPYPSVARGMIENMSDDGVLTPEARESFDRVAKNTSSQSYLAGGDTSVSAGQGMMLALAAYPEVQRKAREEVDSVIGPGQLPKLSDKERMPYIRAMVKELNRWYSIVPLCLPHVNTEDDEFSGYFIPKGSYVLPNIWAIMHDPDTFEDPMEFKPERYLKDGQLDTSVLDPEAAAFGFGRRICPGRYLSNDVMFLLTASLVATFDLSPPKDDQGNPIPLELKIQPDIIAYPLPFKLTINPRFQKL